MSLFETPLKLSIEKKMHFSKLLQALNWHRCKNPQLFSISMEFHWLIVLATDTVSCYFSVAGCIFSVRQNRMNVMTPDSTGLSDLTHLNPSVSLAPVSQPVRNTGHNKLVASSPWLQPLHYAYNLSSFAASAVQAGHCLMLDFSSLWRVSKC